MKRILFILIFIAILSGCGTGSYSISSGKADVAAILFTDLKAYPITVIVDEGSYVLSTVKYKPQKKDRNFKKTTANTLKLKPGQHKIEVLNNGKSIYSKTVFISANETKIIEL
jgi:hypothetical protein